MPTYEYACARCERVFEVRQRISEAPLTVCEVCGGAIRRLLSPAPFILKGGGWYVTDYPSESRKKALETEKTASPASGSQSDGKPDAKSSTPSSTAPSSSSSTTGPSASEA